MVRRGLWWRYDAASIARRCEGEPSSCVRRDGKTRYMFDGDAEHEQCFYFTLHSLTDYVRSVFQLLRDVSGPFISLFDHPLTVPPSSTLCIVGTHVRYPVRTR